jgi:hypothetical protein
LEIIYVVLVIPHKKKRKQNKRRSRTKKNERSGEIFFFKRNIFSFFNPLLSFVAHSFGERVCKIMAVSRETSSDKDVQSGRLWLLVNLSCWLQLWHNLEILFTSSIRIVKWFLIRN